jgi:hypothetical protein
MENLLQFGSKTNFLLNINHLANFKEKPNCGQTPPNTQVAESQAHVSPSRFDKRELSTSSVVL